MKKIHKIIIFTFFIGLIINSSAYANGVKFVQITDSHFSSSAKDASQKEVEYSTEVLDKTIDDINCLKSLDFVIFSGDNIDKANPDDLKTFVLKVNKLHVPYYLVIGNHEVFKSQNLTKKDYMKIASKYSNCFKGKNPNYVFQKKGIVFIIVDGAKEVIPGPAGYYKKSTLAWLDKQLTNYKHKKVVIVQHFPIVEPYYNRSHTTYNVKDYEDVLKKHTNVIAIFSGHYHANAEVKKDGIYHVSSPALIVPPHNYKVVEIIKDKNEYQIYTQLRHAEDQ